MVYTDPPENWDQFHGSVYLLDIEWGIDWIKSAAIAVDRITIAVYDGGDWTARPSVDLFPLIVERNNRLTFEVQLSAEGHLPKPDTYITADVTVALCGENAHLVKEN